MTLAPHYPKKRDSTGGAVPDSPKAWPPADHGKLPWRSQLELDDFEFALWSH